MLTNFLFLFFFTPGYEGASDRAGPRGNKLAWDVQVHTMAYEPQPDEEIRPGRDAPCGNLRHGIGGVARMNKEGRSARFWMILRDT